MLLLDKTVMCVTFLWNHNRVLVILCLLLSASSGRALLRFFPHVVHVKVRDGPALELMLKGVCMFECECVCLCKWGASSTHYRFGRWEAFLWPLHAERRTFYDCRILFPSSMSFITGKKHQESREWGWLYQSLLCEHLRGSSVQSS